MEGIETAPALPAEAQSAAVVPEIIPEVGPGPVGDKMEGIESAVAQPVESKTAVGDAQQPALVPASTGPDQEAS
jgi:hypothetical protein